MRDRKEKEVLKTCPVVLSGRNGVAVKNICFVHEIEKNTLKGPLFVKKMTKRCTN